MGFVDYVAEYFRGPAGPAGPAGPPGPPGTGIDTYMKMVQIPANTFANMSGSTADPRRWYLEVGPDAVVGFNDFAISGGWRFNINGTLIPTVISSTPFNYSNEGGNWLFEGTCPVDFVGNENEMITFHVVFVRKPAA